MATFRTSFTEGIFSHEVTTVDGSAQEHLEACRALATTAVVENMDGKRQRAQVCSRYLVAQIPSNQDQGGTEFVVWLYPGTGKYKFCTVYARDFHLLWFEPNTAQLWPTRTAPKSEEAASGGHFQQCQPRRALLQETGETGSNDDGKRFWKTKFDGYDDGTDWIKGSPSPDECEAAAAAGAQAAAPSPAVTRPVTAAEAANTASAIAAAAPVRGPVAGQPLYQRMTGEVNGCSTAIELDAVESRINEYRDRLSVDEAMVVDRAIAGRRAKLPAQQPVVTPAGEDF